ncbi:MAG: 2-dehydropantoate 2-reductase [Anaerolineales bacterium]|nr:2-dehydropantoate 2-reductase [Anaerolineales bacterium]
MRYLVYGTGAVGGLVGARLALAGQSVVFLARPKVAQAMRDKGLRITGDGSPGRLENPWVVTDLQEAFQRQIPEVILLTVKAYDCQQAGEAILAQSPHPIPVLSLLNGIGSEEILASILGSDQVLSGTLTSAVQKPEPGVVRITRQRGVGLASDHPLVPKIHDEMVAAGLSVRLYSNRERMKWSKLLANIIANASSAILGWSSAQIFSHSGLYRLEIEALREGVRVMRRKGIHPVYLPRVPVNLLGRGIFLPPAILRPILSWVVSAGRGEKLPSLHHDLGRGRSEVTWLNGSIVLAAAGLNLPTPANRVLTDTLLSLVDGRSPPAAFHNRPEVLISRARDAGVPGI